MKNQNIKYNTQSQVVQHRYFILFVIKWSKYSKNHNRNIYIGYFIYYLFRIINIGWFVRKVEIASLRAKKKQPSSH